MSAEEKNKKLPKLSTIDENILTVLRCQEMYGLEILEDLNEPGSFPLSFSSLYPALNRMEKKGLVKWRWGDDKTGGARRKYYRVTGLGERSLKAVQSYRKALNGLRPRFD